MKRTVFRRAAALLTGGLVLFLSAAPVLKAQADPDAASKKKYEKFLGKYEFEITGADGAPYTLEVVVREGALWIDDGDGFPVEIKPAESKPLEFSGEDTNNGPVKATFTADDSGAIVKIRVELPNAGMDITGKKLK